VQSKKRLYVDNGVKHGGYTVLYHSYLKHAKLAAHCARHHHITPIIMNKTEFDALVQHLEQVAENNPVGYRWRVFGLALLGYSYIVLVLTLLLAANGFLIYALVNDAPAFIVAKLGFIIGALTFLVLRAMWVRIPPPTGIALNAKQAPALYALLKDIRHQLHGPKIHQVLLNEEFNAAVMQHPRLGIFGWHKNYLLLGMPLMQALSPEQFKAVLAHEYGHLSGAHSKFSAWIYRIRRTWQQVMERLEEDTENSWGKILFTGFFRWYIPFFNAYSFVLARLNEYDADRSAVEVAGSQAAAQGLINVEIKARFLHEAFWQHLYATVQKHPRPVHQPFTLMPKAWQKISPQTTKDWLQEAWHDQTDNDDTHPCLRDRLTAIQESLQLPNPITENAAEHYFGTALPSLLATLNEQWRTHVQDSWQQRHADIQQDKRTLKDLLTRAKTEQLTLEEQWACANLVAEFYGDDKAAKFYRAVLQQDAHHAGANYALGKILLDRQNPKGVPLLNRAMTYDSGYTLHACQVIYTFLHYNGHAQAAQKYREKLEQRYDLEAKAQQERQDLDIRDGLLSHELTDAQLQPLIDQLSQQAGIKKAYLIRKAVEYLPESPFYVLGILRTYSLLRTGGGDRRYNEQLAEALALPDNIMVVVLGTEARAFYDRIIKVPDALIYRKSRPAKTVTPPPQKNATVEPTPTAAPITTSRSAKPNKALLLGSGLVIGLLATVLLIDNPLRTQLYGFYLNSPSAAPPIPSPASSAPTQTALQNTAQPIPVIPLSEQLQQFEWRSALRYDARFAEGLQQALQHYFKLFVGQTLQPIVGYQAMQLSPHRFELTYQVMVAQQQSNYRLTLSTAPDQLTANLQALQNVLQQVRQDFPPTSPLPQVTANTQLTIATAQALGELDSLALFQLIQRIEQALLDGQAHPQILLSASEVFAWLGFFSNAYRHSGMAELLAAQAVSNYLLGSVFSEAAEQTDYYRGLMLLMLDYPAPALTALITTTTTRQQQLAQLLRAFIQFDFPTLQRLAQQPDTQQKIASYLIGRAYKTSNQHNLATPFFRQLMERYPNFLLAKAYIADKAPVGIARLYSYQYFSQLIEQQSETVNTLLDMEWETGAQALYQAVKLFLVAGKHGQEWLHWHRDALQQDTALRSGAGILLSADWLRAFLQQEMYNALALVYHLELHRLARETVAESWLAAITDAYPDTPLVTALQLKFWQAHQKSTESFALIDAYDMQQADRYLLTAVLDNYGRWRRAERRPPTIALLQRLQQLQAPNFSGSLQLQAYAHWLGYLPAAHTYLQQALALNPYHHRPYQRLARIHHTDAFIQQGESYADRNYGFLLTVADWYREHEQLDQALTYYQRAMDASPVQSTAYLRSGEIYAEQQQYEQALAVWQMYLDYDDGTLSAVRVRNAMGRLYLAQNDPEQAYTIFRQTVQSGQYGAMAGYAQSLEALQRLAIAENAFRKAAERYPGSAAPTELALFYLRQDQPAQAIETLKAHRSYHAADYYYAALVTFMLEQGTPHKAIDIVTQVEAGSAHLPFYLAQLAEQSLTQQASDLAKSLLRDLATVTDNPRQNRPEFFGVKYIDAVAQTEPDKVLAATQALLDTYAMLPEPVMVYFALGLIEAGYADAGLQGLIRAIERSPRNRQTHLILAALAWQIGSQTEADKQTIQTLLTRYAVSEWAALRMQFLLNEADVATVWQQANSLDRQCEVHYYLAAIYAQQGDNARAIQHVLLSLETQATRNIEYQLAVTLLENLT